MALTGVLYAAQPSSSAEPTMFPVYPMISILSNSIRPCLNPPKPPHPIHPSRSRLVQLPHVDRCPELGPDTRTKYRTAFWDDISSECVPTTRSPGTDAEATYSELLCFSPSDYSIKVR